MRQRRRADRSITGARVALQRLATGTLLLAPITGCGTIAMMGGGSAEIVSLESPVMIQPSLPTRAYSTMDENTADIYLTDFPRELLEREALTPDEAAELTGQFVHLHLFLRPRPGRTPIADSAMSATVRYVVVARGEIGVYMGAGFLFPRSTPGNSRFSGRIVRATLRLEHATPGFRDALGPAELSLDFAAPLDEDFSALVADRVTDLVDAAAGR